MKVSENYVKAHCVVCADCGKERMSCWVDQRKNTTLRPCRKCGSHTSAEVVVFTRSEYKLFENPGRVKVRLS